MATLFCKIATCSFFSVQNSSKLFLCNFYFSFSLVLVWNDIELDLLLLVTICQMLAGNFQVRSAEQSCSDFVNQHVHTGADSQLWMYMVFWGFFFYKDSRKTEGGTEDGEEKSLDGEQHMWLLR